MTEKMQRLQNAIKDAEAAPLMMKAAAVSAVMGRLFDVLQDQQGQIDKLKEGGKSEN